MFWKRNDFTVCRFLPNTDSHFKITAADEINPYLKSLNLWRYAKSLQKLSSNMRVALLKDPSAQNFSRQLLTICNGRIAINGTSGLIRNITN